MNVPRKYPALHTIAGLYGTLAWISVAICALMAFYAFSSNNVMSAATSALAGAILWATLKAISEVLHVVMDIEENTRKSEHLAEFHAHTIVAGPGKQPAIS